MKRIYLSGAMSNMPDLNFPLFNVEAERLRALGYDVVNPVDINPDTTTPYNECLRNDRVEGRDAASSRRVPLERRVGRQTVKRSDDG